MNYGSSKTIKKAFERNRKALELRPKIGEKKTSHQ